MLEDAPRPGSLRQEVAGIVPLRLAGGRPAWQPGELQREEVPVVRSLH